MRMLFIIGAACALSACSTVPALDTGTGGFDGVELPQTDMQSCPGVAIDMAAPTESARDQMVRCTPQSQPIIAN